MAIGIIVCRFVSDYTYHCSIIYRLKEMIDLLSSLETRVVGHMVVSFMYHYNSTLYPYPFCFYNARFIMQ